MIKLASTLLLLLTTTCSVAFAQQSPTKETVELKKSDLPKTRNVHQAGNVVLAGQPSQEALKTLADRGFKTVISLRHPAEDRFDQAATCAQLGMKFIRLPISGPDDMNQKLIGTCCTILKTAKPDSGVVLHCASANRVGAIWLAYRVKQDGLTIEQARREAAEVGLQTRELESQAIEYLNSDNE